MNKMDRDSLKPIADKKALEMRCNCDLDNWQPDTRTGHSWVCRIHKAAIAELKSASDLHVRAWRVRDEKTGESVRETARGIPGV